MSSTKKKEKDLGKAAENGDLAAVRRMLNEGVDPNNFEYVSSSNEEIDLTRDITQLLEFLNIMNISSADNLRTHYPPHTIFMCMHYVMLYIVRSYFTCSTKYWFLGVVNAIRVALCAV